MDDEQLARALQAEELAAAGGPGGPTLEDSKQEFLEDVQHGIHKAMSVEDPELQRRAAALMPLQQLRESAEQQLALQTQLEALPGHIPLRFNSALAAGSAAANSGAAAAGSTGQPVRAAGPQQGVEDLLVKGLLTWFKTSFFIWMNSPACKVCGCADTEHFDMLDPSSEEEAGGAARVEGYSCPQCESVTRFPRYTNPRNLLESRTGRCGEWAHTFLLCLRAAGLEARHCQDWADHVWTEYYSPGLGRWVHTDACEAAWDTPLLYEQGWGKQQSYVIAVGRTGVVDVTRRYTATHATLPARRTQVPEPWLVEKLGVLSQQLRAKLDTATVRQAVARDIAEQLQLLTLGGPQPQQQQQALPGRQSGCAAWREARGETGADAPRPPTVWTMAGDTTLPQLFTAAQRLVGGACRASGENQGAGQLVGRLFDGRLGSKWLDFGGAGEGGWAWVQYQLLRGQGPQVITSYDLVSAEDCPERDPTTWRLEGWVPQQQQSTGAQQQQQQQVAGRWVALHEVQGCSWRTRNQLQSFHIPPEQQLPCTCWRLVIGKLAQPAAANCVQLCAWNMNVAGSSRAAELQPHAAAPAGADGTPTDGLAAPAAATAQLPYMNADHVASLVQLAGEQQQSSTQQQAPAAGSDAGSLLLRILQNLQQHPGEDKYCQLRAAKVEPLLSTPAGTAVLLAVGFRPLLKEMDGEEQVALVCDGGSWANQSAVACLLQLLKPSVAG